MNEKNFPGVDPEILKLLENILDGADEWSNYVVEDTAPRSLRRHLEDLIAKEFEK